MCKVVAFGKQYTYLAEFLIFLLHNHEGLLQLLAQGILHFLYLYLDATAAYHIVFPALDAEDGLAAEGGGLYLGDVVGE